MLQLKDNLRIISYYKPLCILLAVIKQLGPHVANSIRVTLQPHWSDGVENTDFLYDEEGVCKFCGKWVDSSDKRRHFHEHNPLDLEKLWSEKS